MIAVLLLTISFVGAMEPSGLGPEIQVDTAAGYEAMGVALVRLRFAGDRAVARLSVTCEADDSIGRCPQEGDVPYASVDWENGETTVLAPFAVLRSERTYSFVFGAPGRYSLMWFVHLRDGTVLRTAQEIQVAPVAPADRSLLDEAVEKLLDAEWDNVASDMRRAYVIHELLSPTSVAEPFEGRFKSKVAFDRWVSVWAELATKYPASRYAPYAAYFAGSGRVSYVAETGGEAAEVSDPTTRNEVSEAQDNLRFAGDHGDTYLAPRAVIQAARAEVLLGNWDAATSLMANVRQVAPKRGSLVELLDQVENDAERLRDRREAHRP